MAIKKRQDETTGDARTRICTSRTKIGGKDSSLFELCLGAAPTPQISRSQPPPRADTPPVGKRKKRLMRFLASRAVILPEVGRQHATGFAAAFDEDLDEEARH